MFVITLTFSANRARAGAFMDAHNAWIAQGFADGAFLAVGALKPGPGGGILAVAPDRAELEERVAGDPFVAQGIVEAAIIEIAPVRTDPRLAFLGPE